MSDNSLHILVIGGGIGGLCLAHGLRRADISVAVCERTRARTDWLQGYRIHISPHGARALQACLPATHRIPGIIEHQQRPELPKPRTTHSRLAIPLPSQPFRDIPGQSHAGCRQTQPEWHADGTPGVNTRSRAWASEPSRGER